MIQQLNTERRGDRYSVVYSKLAFALLFFENSAPYPNLRGGLIYGGCE